MSWYGDNSNRAFPFLDVQGRPIPDSLVVDFGCEVGTGAEYLAGLHSVWLASIRRMGGVYIFSFLCDAPGIDDAVLQFDVPESGGENYSTRSSAGGGSASSDGPGCGRSRWSGFLVTGDLSELGLGDGQATDFGDSALVVEPAVIDDVDESGVQSVSLFNSLRTKIPTTVSCSSEQPADSGLYAGAECLMDDLEFRPGYNCSILQSDSDNSLTFGAGVGAGQGEPCGEVPITEEEALAGDASPLSGGSWCSGVLRSINGVGGKILPIEGGDGVTVRAGTVAGQLEIDIHLNGMAVCQTPSSSV